MADSINLGIGYFDHIKTVRLVSILGRGAEMLPVKLWCYCGMHPNDNGTLIDFSAGDVEAVILRWWGKPGQAVEALVKVGFLDFDGTTYKAHGFDEKNGHIMSFHKRAVKAASVRWNKLSGDGCSSNATSNATSIAKQCHTDRPTVLPTELPTNQKEKYIGTPRSTFKRPSVDDVRDFIRSNRYEVEADTFHAYYESNGWKVGRNPMRNWKAAVRTWHGKQLSKGGLNGNQRITGEAGYIPGKYSHLS